MRHMQARPPTMNDVAAAASVSLKTVSRFVNGATNIDPVLAARIGAAIEALDYRHNLAAASIRPGRSSKLIGLVISDLANPYFSSLARSIERVCSERGYLLMSMSSDEDAERHQLLIDRLIAQRVDGLIVVPPRHDPNPWAEATGRRIPLVVVDRPVAAAGIHTILADNAGGAEAATAELLRQGARRVAFIGDSLELHTMRERLAGYRRAIERDDLEFSAQLTFTGAHTADEASGIVRSLLEKNGADAIFAANNRSAIGAVRAFALTGRRLPLIGFDDFEAAPLVNPAVSVVAQDVAQMGRAAAEAVLAAAEGHSPPVETRVLPTRLVLRGSEAP